MVTFSINKVAINETIEFSNSIFIKILQTSLSRYLGQNCLHKSHCE